MLSEILLPNGTRIRSGEEPNAILSATVTQCVNDGNQLNIGSVCSSMLEAELFLTEPVDLQAGMEVSFYRDGVSMGIFILEKPEHSSTNRCRITAYDRISRLDQDLTQWLSELIDWPYSLYDLAWMVSAQCGLELSNTSIPNGAYMVERFTATAVTGRQLMQWIAQAAGQFCRATAEGLLEFAWYKNGPVTVGTTGEDVAAMQSEHMAYFHDLPSGLQLKPVTEIPPGVRSVTLTECGANQVNIYGYSARIIPNPGSGRYASNPVGTMVSVLNSAPSVAFTQNKTVNTVAPYHENNGYFYIGVNHPFVQGQQVTVSFQIRINTNPLKVSALYVRINGTGTGAYTMPMSGNNRLRVTLPWQNNGQSSCIQICVCGCSGTISNIQVEPGAVMTPYAARSVKSRIVTLPDTNGGILDWTGGVFTNSEGQPVQLTGVAVNTRAGSTVCYASDGNTTMTYEQLGCFQNRMQYADYTVQSIDGVLIRQNEKDVGICYPDGGENIYDITANPLLTANTAQELETVAQTLHTTLSAVSYRPCTLKIPAKVSLRAGHKLLVTDRKGNVFTAYVMKLVQGSHAMTITCSGDYRRDCSIAAAQQRYESLHGRVMELSAQVEGLRAENRDAADNGAKLELSVEGILTQVQQQEHSLQAQMTQMTQLQQDAAQLQLTVQTLENDGTSKVKTRMGYSFDDTGLHISASGSQLINSVTEKGMYVIRGGDTVMLQADADGVVARDVSVANYLIIGDHARLEDYADGADTKRTACFFIGG